MSVPVEWTDSAFHELEALPPQTSFEGIKRVDLLEAFPEIGVSLGARHRILKRCRQLVVEKFHRVIYEYESRAEMVYVLAVQHCRQKLPTVVELRRRLGRSEAERDQR